MSHTNIAYRGQCAFAMSLGKKDVPGGKSSLTIGSTKYQFSNPVAKFLFKLLPNTVQKADQHWAQQEVKA